jgi:asparagine synthase (glutamine-hydrolysing)
MAYFLDHSSGIAQPFTFQCLRIQPHDGDPDVTAGTRGGPIVMPESRRVVALTDSTAQFPLFTAAVDRDTLVSADVAELALRTNATACSNSLAAEVVCPGSGDLVGSGTPYRGIIRLPDDVVLTVDSRGLRHDSINRTTADEDVSTTGNPLRRELLEALRTRLAAASTLSADFSGGIDSSSLAFLAANGRERVHCLTSRSFDQGDHDDVEYALRFAELHGGLTHWIVPESPGQLPFADLRTTTDQPCAAPFFVGPTKARLARARELGSTHHLVGEGGDLLFSPPPVYLADLARKGQFTMLWRHCRAWARLRTRSPQQLFRRAMAIGIGGWRHEVRTLASSIGAGTPAGPPAWEDDWIAFWPRPQADWLTVRARRALAEEIHEVANRPDPTRDTSCADVVTRGWLRQQSRTMRVVRAAGAELGIEVHAPFLDPHVVRAALSVPAHLRVDPRAPKRLLRSALTGLVPDSVLSRPTKGDYSRDAYRGVRAAAPALRRLLTDPAAADHRLIEPRPVRDVLEVAIDGRPIPWGPFNQLLALELWLRQTGTDVADP